MISHNGTKYNNLFALLEDKKSIVAWNEHKQIAQSQVGGMTMMATGLLSNFMKPPSQDKSFGKDPLGLGQWCSLLVNGSSGPVRIVTYYRPNGPTKMEAEIANGL